VHGAICVQGAICAQGAICVQGAPHTRTSRWRQFLRPVPSLYSRASRARALRLRGSAAAPRLRAARTPTLKTCAHCPNVFVPIWGSIGPARWAPMRYVWCCVHVCARINAHPRSPTPITSAHCSNECFYQFGPRSAQPFGSLCYMCTAMRTFVRARRT
jgi:hypothetical protein